MADKIKAMTDAVEFKSKNTTLPMLCYTKYEMSHLRLFWRCSTFIFTFLATTSFITLFLCCSVFAGDLCRRCTSSEIEPVSLTLADPIVQEKVHQPMIHSWGKAEAGTQDMGVVYIKNSESLVSIFKQIAGSCKKIVQLKIFGHGFNGRSMLGDFDLNVANVSNVFKGFHCVMASDATIDFGGCVECGCLNGEKKIRV